MSTKQVRQRAEERRHAAIERGRGIHYKLGRILDMYEDGVSDADIAQSLGWSVSTVIRYRKVLHLALGRASGGRWSKAS